LNLKPSNTNTKMDNSLFQDLARIIDQGKNHLAKQVKSTITVVYWQVGKKNK